jgi:chitinase
LSSSVTTPDVNTLSLVNSNEAALPGFVTLAHQYNVMAAVSIGGWGGSEYFSSAVGSAQNRTAFVQTVLNLVSQYNLDGIDFEYVLLLS